MPAMRTEIASKLGAIGPQEVLRAVFTCTHCSFTLFRALYGEDQKLLHTDDVELGACDGCGIGLLQLSDVFSDQEWYLQQPHFVFGG